MNNAAAATIQTSDPVVGPGQYLKIETTARYGGSAVTADGTQVSWQEKPEARSMFRRTGRVNGSGTVKRASP